jgi:DNA-binding transcriptional LysR family regulator
MDEELLRTFTAVCRTGSVTQAATDLFRSQSAISRRIAQLEADMGAPLFDRVPDGMRLSAAGETLRPYAEAAVASMEDGRQAVREMHESDRGPVSLALVGTLASTWLTGALKAFATDRPGVDVRLQTANSTEVLDLVRSGAVSIGIGYGRGTGQELGSQLLFSERLAVACSPEHPLVGEVASLGDLRDEQWFAFADRWPRQESNARFVAGVLATAGIPADLIQTIDSLTAQKRLIEAGFGIGLLPASSIADESAAGALATILTEPELATDVWLTTRTQAYLSHPTRSLLRHLARAAGTPGDSGDHVDG